MEPQESMLDVDTGTGPTYHSKVDGAFAAAIAPNAVFDGGQIVADMNGNPPSLGHSMESN